MSAVGAMGLIAVLAFLVLSPSGGDFGRRDVPGPPRVRPDVAAAHADQFDNDLPDRTAGSQQEQAAAIYLLGVFQQNGYVVRLEAVPVANLVSSTDLIASPPGVEDLSALVVVPYSSSSKDAAPSGPALGVMLEVARALNVASPDHTVGFAAVGAESTADGGGALGSRRLAQLLNERGEKPVIVRLVEVTEGAPLASSGPDELFGGTGSVSLSPDVFGAAGFARYLVSGSPEEVGTALLQGLQRLRQ